MKRMKIMSGKISSEDCFKDELRNIFESQVLFQESLICDKKLPADVPNEYQKSVTLLIEELGELLKTDKRWKSLRKNIYDRDEKLNEYADVFITVLNIAIYSGFTKDEIVQAVLDKIQINFGRLALEYDNNSRGNR
jgi:NTP pyrophosphatase (non-canonical NTP hydrolase)